MGRLALDFAALCTALPLFALCRDCEDRGGGADLAPGHLSVVENVNGVLGGAVVRVPIVQTTGWAVERRICGVFRKSPHITVLTRRVVVLSTVYK